MRKKPFRSARAAGNSEMRESGSRKLDGRVEKLRSYGGKCIANSATFVFREWFPGWRQVPFNLTGVCERGKTDENTDDCRLDVGSRSRNDRGHRLHESQPSHPQIPAYALRSFHRPSFRVLVTAKPFFHGSRSASQTAAAFGRRESGRSKEFSKDSICVFLGAKNLEEISYKVFVLRCKRFRNFQVFLLHSSLAARIREFPLAHL